VHKVLSSSSIVIVQTNYILNVNNNICFGLPNLLKQRDKFEYNN